MIVSFRIIRFSGPRHNELATRAGPGRAHSDLVAKSRETALTETGPPCMQYSSSQNEPESGMVLAAAEEENHVEDGEDGYEDFQDERARLVELIHHEVVKFAEGVQLLFH